MADVSAEPSMEDILSSIKRIIAEEGDAVTGNARAARRAPRQPVAGPRADPAFDDEEILELNDELSPAAELSAVANDSVIQPIPANDVPADEEMPSMIAAQRAEPILSPKTEEASRGSLEALSRMIVRPQEPGADTLEGLVREMVRPMLREWLDARLPVIVETMVAQEIARITKQG